MAISKVILNSDVQMDITDTTATQGQVASTAYYYGADGVKKQGSYVVPSAVTQATPTISVNSSTGLITASSTQSAGVVSAGTKSATEQLSTENGKTVTPTTSEQTAVAANKYTLGAIKVAAMPAGSAGTPTATKGTVSNHSVSVTPSVTNTTGYITGSTKTGTAVSISASELVSGTKSISANGTSDVTNYASVDVSVPTGTARDGDDVSVSGATVTVPAGLYSSQVSKTVASGSAATPATSITANPSISVSSGGLITATTSATKSVTPTVSAGYVSSGSAGTITVSGSNTEQLSTQAAQTLYPSTTDQTISSGKYLTGTQTVKGVLLTNLTADNIADGVTVKVGDSADDDRIASVTGTHKGGVVSEPEKDVNYIDYDGTILYSYTKTEFASLSAHPANPVHDGLTAQGWNWTLSNAKTYVATYGKLWIGQMYVTTSGDTEIDIVLEQGRLAPYLGLAVNGSVIVDWGDNSTSTVTGSSLTTQVRTQHTYSTAGNYTIKVAASGTNVYAFYTGSNPVRMTLLSANNTSYVERNRIYAGAIRAVRIGNNVTLGAAAFAYCSDLESVTMPQTVLSTTAISSVFYLCTSLKAVVIPKGATGNGRNVGSWFYLCSALRYISFPDDAGWTSNYDGSLFYGCGALRSATYPSAATYISSSAFYQCYALSNVTVPANVSTIQTKAFYDCRGLGEIHFKPTTPPTVGNSDAWTNVPTDCKIYVPTGYLSTYQSKSNYPSTSSYTWLEE